MNSKKLFAIAFSMLSVCSSIGFAGGGEGGENPVSTIESLLKNSPLQGDSPQEIITKIQNYISSYASTDYNQLNEKDREQLERIIYIYKSDFNPKDLEKYYSTRKLAIGLNTDDIRNLRAIERAISDGKELTAKQVSIIRNLSPIIAAHPTVFLPDLSKIVPYEALNQGNKPNQFNISDLNSVRTSALNAAGITPKEAGMLMAIAAKPSKALNKEDILVIQKFMNRTLFGTINALPAGVVVELNSRIKTTPNTAFEASSVDAFNAAYTTSPVIQEYSAITEFEKKKTSNGSREFKQQESASFELEATDSYKHTNNNRNKSH